MFHRQKDHSPRVEGARGWRPSFELMELRLVPGEALLGTVFGASLLVREWDGLPLGGPKADLGTVRPGMWDLEAPASGSGARSDGDWGTPAITLVSPASPAATRAIPDQPTAGTFGALADVRALEEARASGPSGATASPRDVASPGAGSASVAASSTAAAAPRVAGPGALDQTMPLGQPAVAPLPWSYLGTMLGRSRPPAVGLSTSVPVAATPAAAALPKGPGAPPPVGGIGFSVALTPDQSVPQLVGEPITWTAAASNGGADVVYQFSVGPTAGPFQVVRDFSPNASFTWAPLQEGSFAVQVIAKENFDAVATVSAVVTDPVLSRVTGSEVVLSPTANPLVALYSAPPSSATAMSVNFRPANAPDDAPWLSTDVKTCVPGQSTNFLVAGMVPDTTYEMVSVTNDGTSSPPAFFTTGDLPKELTFPNFTVLQGSVPGTTPDENMVLHMSLSPGNSSYVSILATDRTGQVTWYYDNRASEFNVAFGTSLEFGGRMLLLGGDQSFGLLSTVREIDLAGNILGETNVDAVNAQLRASGLPEIDGFHHDAERLPDGQIAVLGQFQKEVDLNGTPTTYYADMVLVLDQNWQLTWVWDSTEHLDLTRLPTIPDDISDAGVDWTHSNAISWSPTDGDLLVSIRSQDWVVKIDYAYGTGDGHVVWRLGQDGDFTINSDDPYPWFSHQHNASYLDDSTLVLFDDGNTRCEQTGDCESRGQAFNLDEQAMTATPVLNAYVGNYSQALGSAQRLANGNYVFTSGFVPDGDGFDGQTIEMLPDGTITYVLQQDQLLYRSYILSDLYGTDQTTSPPNTAVGPRIVSATPSRVTSPTSSNSGGGGHGPGALGPQIIDQTPSRDAFGFVTSVRVTFNESIDPTTFTPDQVPDFEGPLGPIAVDDVTVVAGSDNTQFDIDFAAQVKLGYYAMIIGPDIRDVGGTPMAAPYPALFTLEGPAVIASSPAGSADVLTPLNTIRVTFNEPIDPTTFTSGQVDYFTGPQGRIQATGVTAVAGSNDTQFDIAFATQGLPGSYTLAIGPDIRDQFGTPMDQNGNFIPGEFPDDLFTLTFAIQGPRLTSQTINDTLGVFSLRVTFDQPMDPQSFTAAQVSSFTGPDGDIPVAVVPVAGSNFTQFDLVFAPQWHAGFYSLTLSPDISDAFGAPLGDSYTLTFTLDSPRIVASAPAGGQLSAVDHVRVTLNYPVNGTSFTPDQVLQFTGPSGDIPVTGVAAVPNTGQTQFDISFDPQSDPGDYQMVFGAGIQDLYGNAVAAGYTAQFRLITSPLSTRTLSGARVPFQGWLPLASALAAPPMNGNAPIPDYRQPVLAFMDQEFAAMARLAEPTLQTGGIRQALAQPAHRDPLDWELDLSWSD